MLGNTHNAADILKRGIAPLDRDLFDQVYLAVEQALGGDFARGGSYAFFFVAPDALHPNAPDIFFATVDDAGFGGGVGGFRYFGPATARLPKRYDSFDDPMSHGARRSLQVAARYYQILKAERLGKTNAPLSLSATGQSKPAFKKPTIALGLAALSALSFLSLHPAPAWSGAMLFGDKPVVAKIATPVDAAKPASPGKITGNKKAIDKAVRVMARKYGIPEQLFVELVWQESRYNIKARSPKGAIGLAQLMPGTARSLGVNPHNPAQNLEGGARYLVMQKKKFGTWRLALAAYNAGPEAVQKYKGVPRYKETQHYVKTILARAGIASEPTPIKSTKQVATNASVLTPSKGKLIWN